MNYIEKYNNIFMKTFSLTEDDLNKNPTMNDIELWDSVGHINLIAEIEDEFNIEISIDEMSELTSYKKGTELIEKHTSI